MRLLLIGILGLASLNVSANKLTGQLEDIMQAHFSADAPGGAAIVVKDGKVLYRGAIGMANLEHGISLKPEMVFRLGSITKQITAVAIMMLVEDGKVALDDPLTKFYPGYPSGEKITVRHLLNHTSGVQSYTSIPGYMVGNDIKRDLSTKELIEVFKDKPMTFQPGEQFSYNNSGYVLLGYIIEEASGMSYEDFIEQKIFKKLGMNHSYFDLPTKIIPNRVSGYNKKSGKRINDTYISMTQPHAAGSLASNVDDMVIWNESLFSGKLISLDSVKQMTTPSKLNNGSSIEYGFGFFVGSVRGLKTINHDGGINGFVTSGFYLPEQNIYTLVLCNDISGDRQPRLVASQMAMLAGGKPYPVLKSIKLPDEKLKSYVGVYQVKPNDNRVITYKDGTLYSQRSGPPSEIQPASETRFFWKGSLHYLDFVFENGELKGMNMHQNGDDKSEYAPLVSRDVPKMPTEIQLSPEELKKHVGKYQLAPGFVLTVFFENGDLYTQGTGQPQFQIFPESKNKFFLKAIQAQIEFTDEGLILYQGGLEMHGKPVD